MKYTHLVCAGDSMVFPISPTTFEALSCGWYDPWCYSDPDPAYVYVPYAEWQQMRLARQLNYYSWLHRHNM